MSPRTLLIIEAAADYIMAAVEYGCYCIIFGAIAIGWWIT